MRNHLWCLNDLERYGMGQNKNGIVNKVKVNLGLLFEQTQNLSSRCYILSLMILGILALGKADF